MIMAESTNRPQPLHEIKGVLTKFMRMLFPLEFRIDSLANSAPLLPFHYPLLAGEMIYLPERVEAIGATGDPYAYYLVTAAHLAARHDFGSFKFKLSDIAGFEARGETGVEAIDCFVESFDDPALAGALMRLGEAARIDAELRRRYRGLSGKIGTINRSLVHRLAPESLSTMLIRASLDLVGGEDDIELGFAHAAARFFEPLRQPGADVRATAGQVRELYAWLKELIAEAARRAGEMGDLTDQARRMRDDLISSAMKGAEGGPESEGSEGEDGEPSGETDQNVQLDASGKHAKSGKGRALSPEELRRLIEQGAEINPSQSQGDADGEGMYLTQLTGKDLSEFEEMREQLAEVGSVTGQGRLMISRGRQESYYAYDEWDYVLGDYRRGWCRLREIDLAGDDGGFFEQTLQRYSELLPTVRRNFQRIRPASYRMVRGLEDGEEIDIDRTIESCVQRRMGEIPDPRVYKARKKEARDVATLFLLDMSASTDEPIHREPRKFGTDDDDSDDWMKAWRRRPQNAQRPRRIIDVNKEALVIMAQALEELGDAYAIMGFSGHGRDNVEFYVIKEFDQELSDEVKARVGAVEPKRSTRMGAAIRHVREKFKGVASRAKHVILLSDGFPQDFDYGHDRRSNAYGIQDTMVALKELELAGVLPFCITVDKTGHDYLRQMCQSSRYLVIEDIASLPRQLPKIYEQVVRW
jgi:nitric oxide reductase NorD protein